MMTSIDRFLDRITMYRLVLYVLLGYVSVAVVLSYFALLPFSPVALLVSTAFLIVMCWAANTVLARIFDVPTNVESATITALILALIIDPVKSPDDLQFLGWAAILAMASKYIIALRNTHLFNPAALAVVVTAFALGDTASWWVGTASMMPALLIGGLLIVRKLRQEDMAVLFVATALVTVSIVSLTQGMAVSTQLQQLLLASPLFFVASIMLTEPLTTPPTRDLRVIYGALTGVLFIPQIHVGPIYSTPELAIVVGNVFSFLVSPKRKVTLKLRRKSKLSADIVDFVFTPSQRLAFAPGQYMEWTLAHPHPDSRGNRRYFTLASSPTEDTVHLGVRFYEHGSTFKHAMYAMNGRTQFVGGQIAGDFTLPPDPAQKLVFIAGGIGITPYRSMLKYLLDTRQRRDIVLIYVNRTVGDIVYKDVLNEADTRLGVRTVYTLTDTTAIPSGWLGKSGRVTDAMILEAAPDYAMRTFYVSGPPDMVRACEQLLKQMGVHGSKVKTDFFPGLV